MEIHLLILLGEIPEKCTTLQICTWKKSCITYLGDLVVEWKASYLKVTGSIPPHVSMGFYQSLFLLKTLPQKNPSLPLHLNPIAKSSLTTFANFFCLLILVWW